MVLQNKLMSAHGCILYFCAMHQMGYFGQFCDMLRSRLQQPLPGYEAQKLMEPPTRQHLLGLPRSEKPREGAVMIAFFPDHHGISTIMIERAVYDGVHSGQIAFPGGRRDPGEISLIHTALRETEEEIGIKTSSLHVLGSLSMLYIPPSNFDVLPVVACLNEVPNLTVQKQEVSDTFFVPLSQLMDPDNCKPVTITNNPSIIRQVPAYCFGNKTVWGATAMIISELLSILPPVPKA